MVNEKKILSIIRTIKSDRKESQSRINGFVHDLNVNLKRQEQLIRELVNVQSEIKKNEHLIEMYKVDDGNKIFDLWELETACGLTNKKYPNWLFDFRKTKAGFNLKTF